jgi:hypothetical protein
LAFLFVDAEQCRAIEEEIKFLFVGMGGGFRLVSGSKSHAGYFERFGILLAQKVLVEIAVLLLRGQFADGPGEHGVLRGSVLAQ